MRRLLDWLHTAALAAGAEAAMSGGIPCTTVFQLADTSVGPTTR